MVKRLRRRPLTAKTGVRFPYWLLLGAGIRVLCQLGCPYFLCADPCSRNKPRRRRAVRAASKENLPDSIHFCEMIFLIFLIYEQMLQAFDRGGQERAWYLYRRLVDQLDMSKLVNRQFEKYWGAELSFWFGRIGRGERDRSLWEMLGWTMPGEQKERLFSCWLTKYEREALISLAWDCGGEEMKRLLLLLKRQLHRNFNPVGQRIAAEYYERLLYCIARGYLETGNLRRARRYITLLVRQGGVAFRSQSSSWGRICFGKFHMDEKFYIWYLFAVVQVGEK